MEKNKQLETNYRRVLQNKKDLLVL